jgi:hypothetical protein
VDGVGGELVAVDNNTVLLLASLVIKKINLLNH